MGLSSAGGCRVAKALHDTRLELRNHRLERRQFGDETDALDRGGLRREAYWTEAIAVGSKDYVTGIADGIKGRMRIKTNETDDGTWSVLEPEAPYGQDADVDERVPYCQILGTKIEHNLHSAHLSRDFSRCHLSHRLLQY